MNDGQAVASVLRGDKQQYEGLVDKYKRMVYAIAWSHLGNSDLTEDAAQETFIKAYRNLGALRDGSRFPSWLARIARNVSLSLIRKESREETPLADCQDTVASAEYQALRESTLIDLRRSMARLSATYREALTLYYLEEQSVRQAADLLGVTESAFKVRLHRARTALKAEMEQQLEDTLTTLRPKPDFTHVVMSVLPVAPSSLIGTSGVFAALGKTTSALGFNLWLMVPQFLVVLGVVRLFSRFEEANIRDIPANAFRKRLIRRNWRMMALLIAISLTVTAWATDRYGYIVIYKAGALLGALGILGMCPLLRVNRSYYTYASIAILVVMLIAYAAIGFFGASPVIFLYALGFANVLMIPLYKRMPRRQDYSLVLRAATGGLAAGTSEKPSDLRLDDAEIRRFILFLGKNWLVYDYYQAAHSFVVKLLPAKITPAFSLFRYGHPASEAVLQPNGDVTSRISPADFRSIASLSDSDMSAQEMESAVSAALRQSLRRFVEGDEEQALAIVSRTPDSEIFSSKNGPAKAVLIYAIAVAVIGAVAGAFVTSFVYH